MARIGVLYGMEESFPPALVDRINTINVKGVHAEHLKVGGVRMAVPSGYEVIIDRISHDIPVLPLVSQERRSVRRQDHQQSLLVERGR